MRWHTADSGLPRIARILCNVSIEFEDRRRGNPRSHWGARISADNLKLFLEKFMELVVNTID